MSDKYKELIEEKREALKRERMLREAEIRNLEFLERIAALLDSEVSHQVEKKRTNGRGGYSSNGWYDTGKILYTINLSNQKTVKFIAMAELKTISDYDWTCSYEDLNITKQGKDPREAFIKAIEEAEEKVKRFKNLKIGASQELCQILKD